MQKVLLKIKGIEARPDVLKNSIRLIVRYDENNNAMAIEKTIEINEPLEKFAADLMKELRSITRDKCTTKSENFLDGFVNVVVDERNTGETEEKLIAGLKKIREQIRGFKNVKTADNYMNKFFDMAKLEIKL